MNETLQTLSAIAGIFSLLLSLLLEWDRIAEATAKLKRRVPSWRGWIATFKPRHLVVTLTVAPFFTFLALVPVGWRISGEGRPPDGYAYVTALLGVILGALYMRYLTAKHWLVLFGCACISNMLFAQALPG